jgi:hypothetical protein
MYGIGDGDVVHDCCSHDDLPPVVLLPNSID